MKSLILGLFLLITVFKGFANDPLAAVSYDSCEYPKIYTSNGIKLGPAYGPYGNVDSATVNGDLTFDVFVEWSNCSIDSYVITYESDTIYRWGHGLQNPKTAHLFQKPGSYAVRISGHGFSLAPFYPFYFYLLPRTVGLSELSASADNIFIYPNPATDLLNIFSGEELTEVIIMDLSSRLIVKEEIQSKEIKLPIGDLPKGIYFVRVATLSERMFLKKVFVQ